MERIIYTLLIAILVSCVSYSQEKKLETIQEKVFQLIFTDQEKAIEVIDSLISKNQNFSEVNQGRHYSLKGVYFGVQNELDSAAFYFSKALKIVPKEDFFYPNLANNLSIVYKKKGEYKNALDLSTKALSIAYEQENNEAKGKLYSEMASLYKSINKYDLAVKYSLKSIEIEEQNEAENQKFIYNKKQRLANLYRELGNYNFAKEIYEEILPYYENTVYIDARVSTYINYAATLIYLNENTKALFYLEKAEQLFTDFQNEELVAFYKVVYANYHAKNGNLSEAELNYKNALSHFDKQWDNYPQTLNAYLSFLDKNNRYKEVVNYSSNFRPLEELETVGLKDHIAYNFLMANAHENLENFQKATTYYKANYALQDSLQNQVNFALAKDLQAKYQNEIITQKNINLNQKLSQESKQKFFILGFGLLSACFLVLLIIKFKNKATFERKLNETLTEKLKIEQKLIDFKDNLLEEQKKELISRSLDAHQLEEDFRQLKANTEKFGEVNENIKSIENVVSPKQQLQKIKYEFARLYPNFQPSLEKKYPALSKSEVLFLTLIKLDFSFKEIASILNISHKSVISKKYRICKKMELNQKDDIYDLVKKQV